MKYILAVVFWTCVFTCGVRSGEQPWNIVCDNSHTTHCHIHNRFTSVLDPDVRLEIQIWPNGIGAPLLRITAPPSAVFAPIAYSLEDDPKGELDATCAGSTCVAYLNLDGERYGQYLRMRKYLLIDYALSRDESIRMFIDVSGLLDAFEVVKEHDKHFCAAAT